ncbi:hypothetical protein [Flavobacterium oreochromis]|uniref:hypothetical protein n=1 Tax=Flavobacterium oreochromis TaxID=2906078 RepID=UPI002164EBC9|nr:hypothetical protein [Flavobacterium oreochromis]
MHEREYDKDSDNKGTAVIGRCIKLWTRGTELIASIEFDMADEFAAKIAGKVDRGFIKMASMYADVITASSDPELIMPGQIFETVTACKLVEISIVEIGGNDDALKLNKKHLEQVQLKKLNSEKKSDMSQFKTVALALGLSADSPEDTILKEVQSLKLAKQAAEDKATGFENQLKGIQTAEATALTDKAVSLGLIPESLKDTQIKAFEANHEVQKAILSKLIEEKEGDDTQSETHKAVKEVVLSGKGKQAVTTTEETFDYLQKHNPVKLGLIRKDDPAKYEQLAKDYANGVRHKEDK